jgi:hypothetical protein
MESFSKIIDDFKNFKWEFPQIDLPFFQQFHPFSDKQDFTITIVFIILLLLLILSQQQK